MSKMTRNFEVKKSSIAIGSGILITIALGIGIYLKRDVIKQFLKKDKQEDDETIVNDVSGEVTNDDKQDINSNTVSSNESTPVPLTKGKTILDTLVEENEKLRNKEDRNSQKDE